MSKVKKIALCALLLASTIVLARFLAIRTPILSIGFSFVPVMLSAIMLGPVYAVGINVLADLIGALLFPSGAFYFGFTISAALSGLIYGLVLYRPGPLKADGRFVLRLVIASLLVTVLVHGVLNTIWVMAMVEDAASIVMPVRIAKQLVMLPVQVVTMLLLARTLQKPINGLKNDQLMRGQL